MNFEQVARVLSLVANTGSTNSKKELLQQFGSLDGLKDIIKFIYDPSFTTGIGKAKLGKAMYNCIAAGTGKDDTPEEIMAVLRGSNTGNDYTAMRAAAFVLRWDAPADWLAEGLVTQDLQMGCNVTMFNIVFGEGFIPIVKCMKGVECPDNAYGTYIESEKIDGQRRMIFKHNDDNIYAFTNSGKPDPYLVDILPAFKQLPDGYMYDCELTAIGNYNDSIELRQATNSRASVKGPRTGLKANIFDIDKLDGTKRVSQDRKAFLASIFGDITSLNILEPILTTEYLDVLVRNISSGLLATSATFVDVLPVLGLSHSKEEAVTHAKPIWDAKREGLMLLKANTYYEKKRTKNLLKIKLTKDYTLTCTGVNEGDGRNTGLLGSISVDYKGFNVDVGTGFSDYERELYWFEPDEIVGKEVEIESFGESTNQQGGLSLNCPRFKRIKGDD